MKLLLVFLFIGFAAAFSPWEKEINELGEALRDDMEQLLVQINDSIDQGNGVPRDLVEEAQDIFLKLRELGLDIGTRNRKLAKEIETKVPEALKTVSVYSADRAEELTFRDMFRKLKEHLKNNVDKELLKEKIEKIFGQGSEVLRHFLKVLKEKGQRKLEILIDSFLDDRESRSLKEYWEKVKNYFKDLKIDLQEKYMKFGEWVKDNFSKGLETSKDKLDNIRAIAKEFVRHAKNVSKEVGAEASEFFRQYKDDLGNIWDELKDTFQQIKNRKD